MNSNRAAFIKGFKDAFPVFVGYFGVAIALGITAVESGLSPFQATLMSLTNLTSAGQAVALNIMADKGSYLEVFISQVVINLRYLLMGAALSFKLKPSTGTGERLLMSYGITDEVFGLSSSQSDPLSAWYVVGCWSMALPGWVFGTLLGSVLGNVLPQILVDALSLGLYAMFIAIILPKAKSDFHISVVVIASMLCSFGFSIVFKNTSSGTRTVILTILISIFAALVKPVEDEEETENGQ